MKIRFHVALNGTKSNPFTKYGLKHNPFPQLGQAQHDSACLALQSLGGEPIPPEGAEAHIRTTLGGHFTDEFIDRIVRSYKPGEYVAFDAVCEWEE